MSMYLNFTPHSWYYEFAIKRELDYNDPCEFLNIRKGDTFDKYCGTHKVHNVSSMDSYCEEYKPKWSAFTDDGNTYSIIELSDTTLEGLKHKIVMYWLRGGKEKVPAYYYKRLVKSRESYEKLHANG